MGDLFGLTEAEKQIERLFIGVMLTPQAARAASDALVEAREAGALRGADIREDRLHVTLIHIGDYLGAIPESIKQNAARALSAINGSAFDVVFGKSGSFAGAPRKHPFVLLSDQPEAIAALREEVWTALVRGGVKTLSKTAFTPHVTLSYAESQRPVTPVSQPVRWRVDEVLLIHSEVGRSTYHVLSRITLAA